MRAKVLGRDLKLTFQSLLTCMSHATVFSTNMYYTVCTVCMLFLPKSFCFATKTNRRKSQFFNFEKKKLKAAKFGMCSHVQYCITQYMYV